MRASFEVLTPGELENHGRDLPRSSPRRNVYYIRCGYIMKRMIKSSPRSRSRRRSSTSSWPSYGGSTTATTSFTAAGEGAVKMGPGRSTAHLTA
jgi:hypothetical protein